MKSELTIILSIALLLSSCKQLSQDSMNSIVFALEYELDYVNNQELVLLNLDDIELNYGIRDLADKKLIDLNNGEEVYFRILDTRDDRKADHVGFTIELNGKEPLRSFAFELADAAVKRKIEIGVLVENRGEIIYLKKPSDIGVESGFLWSKALANSLFSKISDPCTMENVKPGRWSYTNGFICNALTEMHARDGDQEYLDFIKTWLDCFVADNGTIDDYDMDKKRLDDILPGRALLYVYGQTSEPKYKYAADTLIYHLEHQPKTTDGGYWHKNIYAHQMWLDGIYMADVFAAQYARTFDKPWLIDEAIHQIKLIFSHTYDPNTGLMYHGWDESINDVWSDPQMGTSPEFWGRGIGWYLMALADILDYIPVDHSERDDILQIFRDVATGVAAFQDANSGLWYQVIDKGDKEGNWIETSCSIMFSYAFAKGARLGYLPVEYRNKALNAFAGLQDAYLFLDKDSLVYLSGTVKVGTLNFESSDASFDYYIGVDRRINDFKGYAALMYLTMELEI